MVEKQIKTSEGVFLWYSKWSGLKSNKNMWGSLFMTKSKVNEMF